MTKGIKLKSDSEVFKEWVEKVDSILTQIPLITTNGHMPLDYADDEFQAAMTKLQQASLRFDDMPIYPINETIASKLVWDQLRSADERSDI